MLVLLQLRFITSHFVFYIIEETDTFEKLSVYVFGHAIYKDIISITERGRGREVKEQFLYIIDSKLL